MCWRISENCTVSLSVFVWVCERWRNRETGLQLNKSCLCACSLNPLLLKTQFVWELKETGELLKLAEASLIENQQTTEISQHTYKHTHTVQSNIKPTGYRTHNRCAGRMLTAHAEQSWWISLFASCRWTAVTFRTSSYRLLLLQLTTAGKILPPGYNSCGLWSESSSKALRLCTL